MLRTILAAVASVLLFGLSGAESVQGAWVVRQETPVVRMSEPSTLLLFGVGMFVLARRVQRQLITAA